MDFRAFTSKANGRVNELKTQVIVRLADSLAKSLKIKNGNKSITAIWDTGAQMSSISQRVAQELNLKPIPMVEVHAAGNSYNSPVYKIDVMLPNKVGVLGINVTESDNLQSCDMLIGMDIITLGDFVITNANNKTIFSFRMPPDYKHIDYVVDATKQKKKLTSRQIHKKIKK